MAALLILIPVCFFAAERLSAVASSVSGINAYLPILCVCACLSGAAAYVLYKKKISGWLYAVCAAVGVPVGFCMSGITCAEGFLSKIGGGMLISVYICVLVYLFKGVRLKKPSSGAAVFTLTVLAAANVGAALYAFSCEYIYFWDNAIYWTFARDIAGGSISDGFFSLLYDSVLTFDYNYIAALPPALFAYLFGTSRTVYIFAVVNCFFAPCAAAVYACTKNSLRACAVLLLLPMLLFLALTGFVDVAGFAVCVLCYVIYSGGRNSWKRGFVIGALLALLILIRRWYAFFGVSFIAAMAVDGAVDGRNIRCVLAAMLNVGFILMMFFSPLVINKLLADYSSAYAGYKFSLMTDIRLFARYFGALLIVGIPAVGIWRAAMGDRRTVMPMVQAALCFLLFVRTQTHGQQHLLLYAPSAAVIIAYALEQLDTRVCAAVLAAAVCVTGNTLVDRVQPQSLSEIRHIAVIPDFSMRGRKRGDVREILEIKNRLDEKYSDGRLGVNASSFVINADILKNVQPSLGEDDFGGRYIEELPSVDSRDKDMSRFYEVDYILTTNPVQTHLGEDKQRVVTAADECLRTGKAFGAAYEKENADLSADGIKISIYRRTRAVSDGEKAEFENMVKN